MKELKYDFAVDGFNMNDFWATEATRNTVMLAYNLMRLFRQVLFKSTVVRVGVTASIQQTLQTLRYKLFVRPAYVTTESRPAILIYIDCHPTAGVDEGTLA